MCLYMIEYFVYRAKHEWKRIMIDTEKNRKLCTVRIYKKLIIFVFTAIALFFTLLLTHDLHAVKKKTRLRVGIFDNRPVIYRDKDGRPKGIYVDLLLEMAKHENWELQFVDDTWAGHLQSLRYQNIDIMTSIGYSIERDKYIDYSSENVLTVWGQVYVKSGDPVQNIMEVEGKRVAILKDGINSINFKRLAGEFNVQCEFIPMGTHKEIAEAVERGNVDAGVINNVHGEMIDNSYDIKHAPVMFAPYSLLFSVPEGKHADVLAAIDRHMASWKKNTRSIYHTNQHIRNIYTHDMFKEVIPVWLYYVLALSMGTFLLLVLWLMAQRKLIRERYIAGQELLESEERFKRLSDAAFEGIVIHEKGKILDFNEIYINMFQYTREEIIDLQIIDLVSPEDHTRISKYIDEGNEKPYELTCMKKDGTKFFTEIRAKEIAYHGKTVRVAAIHDITDRKRDEDLIRIQRDLAQKVSAVTSFKDALSLSLDTALEGTKMDSGGMYLVNRDTGDIELIYSRGLSPEFVEFVSCFDVESPQSKLLMSGDIISVEHSKLDIPINKIEKNEGLKFISIIPIFHDDQVTACMNVASHTFDEISIQEMDVLKSISYQIGQCITRLRSEEALAESEKRFRNLIEQAPVGVLVSHKGRIEFANNTLVKHTGYDSPREMVGMRVKNLFAPESREQIVQFNTAREKGEEAPRNYESLGIKKNGDIFHYEASVITMNLNEKTYSVGFVSDITNRKKAEETIRLSEKKLRQSLDEKELLIRETYHRVKNNLNVISSLLSLQLSEIKDEKSKNYFKETTNRIMSMNMIHEMLHNAENMQILNTGEYINNLVNTLFQNYKTDLQTIILNTDIQDITIDVSIMIPLGLIINELISNALKYAFSNNTGGELTIILKNLAKNKSELIIKDTGAGLPENFDIHDATSLGIKIVSLLVRQIDGTIEVSNNNGAEFRIVFTDKVAE